MKLIQGYFELDMNCAEFDILIQESIKRAQSIQGNDMSGVPALPVDDFMKRAIVGQCFITSDDGQQLIGVGYKDAELSRIWIAPTAEGKHTIYFDATPQMVENVGLIYESKTGNIISPFNNNKIILSGKAYK